MLQKHELCSILLIWTLGYNASSGIFTAPSSGIYVFDWTVLPYKGQYAYTSPAVNDQFKSWNNCYDMNSKTELSCSKLAVVKLISGDKFGLACSVAQLICFISTSHFLVINWNQTIGNSFFKILDEKNSCSLFILVKRHYLLFV